MDDFELTHALRSLAADDAPMPRAGAIETQLLTAFDARQRRKEGSLWLPSIGLALAASLAAIGFLHDLPGRAAPQPEQAVFVAIPYTIPPSAHERTTVVRMDVEVGALVAAGFDIRTAHPGGSVSADVLFAQDGRAVAIRPINVPIL